MDFFKRLNAFEGVNKANEKLNHHQDFFLLEDDVFIFGKNYFRAVFLVGVAPLIADPPPINSTTIHIKLVCQHRYLWAVL